LPAPLPVRANVADEVASSVPVPPPPVTEVSVAVGVIAAGEDTVTEALGVVVAVGVAVAVPVGVTDAVGVTVAVGVPVVAGAEVVGVVMQAGEVKTEVSKETWPLRARALPSTVALVWTVMDVSARIVPLKLEAVPRVAELPTCQNTLQAWAPLVRMMLLAEAVTRVEATWKMKTELGFPWPSRVSCPLSASEDVEL
jgi:hypothetical protein